MGKPTRIIEQVRYRTSTALYTEQNNIQKYVCRSHPYDNDHDSDRTERRTSRLLQSPHCPANCLQHVRSSGQAAVVCKSRAITHRTLITCNMSCTTWYEGTAQLLSLTELKSHIKYANTYASPLKCANTYTPLKCVHTYPKHLDLYFGIFDTCNQYCLDKQLTTVGATTMSTTTIIIIIMQGRKAKSLSTVPHVCLTQSPLHGTELLSSVKLHGTELLSSVKPSFLSTPKQTWTHTKKVTK